MRRLTAILAIWLGLLGVAVPVLACSMGVAGDGCCPTAPHVNSSFNPQFGRTAQMPH